MNPRGPILLRKIISYVLIGSGLLILLFPQFIGFMLTALGCILLSETATDYLVKTYKELVFFMMNR